MEIIIVLIVAVGILVWAVTAKHKRDRKQRENAIADGGSFGGDD